jgi:prevent-host-death family protein
MKIATISETKNHLSALLDRVRQGETILILDRTHPVARLEPAGTGDSPDDEDRLARLERDGLIRRRPPRRLDSIANNSPPESAGSLLEALISDRNEDR